MANRVVMRACDMAREGKGIFDIQAWIDSQQQSPIYIRVEAEERAKRKIERYQWRQGAAAKRQRPHRADAPRGFPSRAERRNDMHGRKAIGNTKPEDRERVPSFVYHPMAPVVRAAQTAADREKARRLRDSEIDKLATEARRGFNPLAFVLAMVGMVGRPMQVYGRGKGRGR